MTIREIKATANMAGFGIPNPISGVLFGGEDQAHKFIISNQDGAAFSGTVSAKFLRYADNVTVPITGSIEDGKATVTLIENCYNLPGRFKLTIYVTADGSTTAVYCCMGTVDRTDGTRTVDPSGEINLDVTDLINDIATARASIPPEYSALLASIAPTFSASTAYSAGTYVWYDGTLYRFTADHTAGTWTGTDATAAVVSDDLEINWQYNILNSKNLLDDYPAASGTSEGITCTANGDGSYTLTGTSDSNGAFFFFVYDGAIPSDLKSGCKYRCEIDSSTAQLRFAWHSSISPNVDVGDDGGTSAFITTVRAAANYVAIYLLVPGNTTINETVHPRVYVPIGMDSKVNVFQGVAHAGQALVIDDNGNVTTGEAGAPVDPTLSISGDAADAKVTGDEIAELKRAFDDVTEPTRNIWIYGDIDVPSDGFVNVPLETPIQPGAYTLSADTTTTAGASTTMGVQFFKNNGWGTGDRMFTLQLDQGEHESASINNANLFNAACTGIRFLSASGVTQSSGYTASYANIQFETGTEATEYVPPYNAVDTVARALAQSLFSEAETDMQGLFDKALRTNGTVGTSLAYRDVRSLPLNTITGITKNAINAGIANGPELLTNAYAVVALGYIDGLMNMLFALPLTASDANIECAYSIAGNGTTWSAWKYIYKNNTVAPNGTTDMKTAIEAALTANGVCELMPGTYYVSGIEMPAGSEITGKGKSTKLVLLGSVTSGAAITMNNGCTVKNLWIAGSDTELSIDSSTTQGTRHGILWQGDYSTSTSPTKMDDQPLLSIIDDCYISDFTGGAITCSNTGPGMDHGITATNIVVNRCWAGLNVAYYSEFHRFTNVAVYGCYYGCVNNGGNNVFVNCGFSGNICGFIVKQMDGNTQNNNGHGSAIGCVFNHIDYDGTTLGKGDAIHLEGCKSGFVFDGCQIFYGKIYIKNSEGIIFANCNCGRLKNSSGENVPFEINIVNDDGVTNLRTVFFNGCVFTVKPTGTIDNSSGQTAVFWNACYNRYGAVVDGLTT